jgi:hypothetical protein
MKTKQKGLYVADIKSKYKGKEYCTYLVRRSYREGGKVKQETIANITHLPEETREIIRQNLKGRVLVPVDEAMETISSRAHGHVVAVKKMLDELGLPGLISSTPCWERDLVEALIVARILDPQPKLATNRWWHTTTIPEMMSVEDADEDDIYRAMDWLVERKKKVEDGLAKRHLENGGPVLYDVSSSYYEGSRCLLAQFGYNRDKKKGKRQIVYGLLTDNEGRPISVNVYPGSTDDSKTLEEQINKLKVRFGLEEVILAGDRGMLTQVKIDKLKEIGGIDWVSALRSKSIKRLAEQGYIQLSLFDDIRLMEIYSPDYPGERLIVCRNPYLAKERQRTRLDLLAATEKKLSELAKRVAAGRLVKEGKIGEALGRVANQYKMAKHFEFTVGEGKFSYRRNEQSIAQEAALDGFYVIRTSVAEEKWPKEKVVLGYKSLSRVERGFRTLKGVDLRIRPIHHRLEDRVEAHIFLCTLAYYVEWHLRQKWQSMLFDDEYPGEHEGDSPVLPALRSKSALKKASTKKRPDGNIVHSFQTLLSELATIQCNENWIPAIPEIPPFYQFTKPNKLQQEALERLGINVSSMYGRQKKDLRKL